MKTNPALLNSKGMPKLTLFLLISFLVSTFGFSQTIEMDKKFGSLKFYQDGEILTIKATMKLLKANEEAFKHAKTAYNLNGFAFAFRFAGFVGITLAAAGAASSKKENWKVFAWGGGLILASIPFSVFSTKKIVKAVNIYNQGIPIGNNYRKSLNFIVLSNNGGIGIGFKF